MAKLITYVGTGNQLTFASKHSSSPVSRGLKGLVDRSKGTELLVDDEDNDQSTVHECPLNRTKVGGQTHVSLEADDQSHLLS